MGKILKIALLSSLALLLGAVALRLAYPPVPDTAPTTPTEVTTESMSDGCLAIGGNWLFAYGECEYADQTWCDEEGGTWNECESACRHDSYPLAPCTMQCVPVCDFVPDAAPAQTSLSVDEALALVIAQYGNCAESNDCDKMEVAVLSGDESPLAIEIVFLGLKDDSIRDRKTVREAIIDDNGWRLGDVLSEEFVCQTGRGQESFSTDICI